MPSAGATASPEHARASAPGATPGARDDRRVTQAGEVRSARIESLRAVAALGVLLGHIYGFAYAFDPQRTLDDLTSRFLYGGGFGVFLFFALSGYLLFWPFAKRDFGGGDRIDVGRYAVNRALRILPLYYVVVAVVLIFQEGGGTPREWLIFGLFLENFSLDTVGQVNGVLWSLVVELHFYVLLPFIALGVSWVARGSRRRAALVLVGLALASLGLRLATVTTDPTPTQGNLWYYSFPATFFFFVAGMVVALVRLSWEERTPRWIRGPLGTADLWLLASLPLWALLVWRYDWYVLPALASFLIVGACVLPLRPGPLVRMLEWRVLALIGVASYSLYLWHIPLLSWITDDRPFPYLELLGIGVPLSIAVALVSYFAIEAPFLRLRRRWAGSSAEQEDRGATPEPASSPSS